MRNLSPAQFFKSFLSTERLMVCVIVKCSNNKGRAGDSRHILMIVICHAVNWQRRYLKLNHETVIPVITLNQQQQPVNTERCNVQHETYSELPEGPNVPDGSQPNGSKKPGGLNLSNGAQQGNNKSRLYSQNIYDQQRTEDLLSLQVTKLFFAVLRMVIMTSHK